MRFAGVNYRSFQQAFQNFNAKSWSKNLLDQIFIMMHMGFDLVEIFNDDNGRPRDGFPSIESFFILLYRDKDVKQKYDEAVKTKYEVLADNMPSMLRHITDPKLAAMLQTHIKWANECAGGKYQVTPKTLTKNTTSLNMNGETKVLAAVVPPKELKRGV